MKVLMFGWEFPPHISGGLGTACAGLTRALIGNDINVLFVVPVIPDNNNDAADFLVDASRYRPVLKTTIKKGRRRVVDQVRTTSPGTEQSGLLRTVEVVAHLTPYNHQVLREVPLLSKWNRSLPETSNIATHEGWTDHESMPANSHADNAEGVLTGKYGPGLLEEVRRYASIANSIANDNSFDVIHCHDWMTFPAGIAAKKASGKPLVVHVHSTEYDRAGSNGNAEVLSIEREGIEQADLVVAVSHWTKQIIVKHFGVSEDKIRVVHNGIQPKGEREEFLFPELGSHMVTFLGRVTFQKGPLYFVEAAYLVLQEFPEAHFIVAGAGDLLPQIIERVAQLNMSSNFHFTGFLSREQVDQIWGITDAYVMPSVSEPFGISPLEAIQGGVPVILSNQSGVSEVMPHAIKVDFWDIKALAGAIVSVLRYESLSNVLRKNGKQHIEKLTWDKAAKHVKTLYHELIDISK